MRLFSIRDLERFSDIRPHVIRTWEKRYALFDPARLPNNVRLYNLSQVQQLLNIELLCANGYKISHVAGMDAGEQTKRLQTLTSDDARKKKITGKLIIAMFSNDTDGFEIALDSSVQFWGMDGTICNIILPFLLRANLMSYSDSSIEAHFAVTAIRRKLIAGIERLKPVREDGKTALLFLPAGEHFDLLLLYISYWLKKEGFRVLYLGTNISLNNLKAALDAKQPHWLYTCATENAVAPIAQYAALLRDAFPHLSLTVVYAGSPPADSNPDQQFIKYRRFDALPVCDELGTR